ncbi:His-Xaa-Ser system protein HxsD [uncultured Phenylobacterium sp.]|uniref:His-Xaa-Ser system protein HxsD n=1 Tax=uncultured Phenylobacterium sp. TaxID=349273 RepID=UPI0025F1CE35|nr:His-Xaa-Ser system protein HxsD [uncultured Phenylobacterium sp.]
MLAEFPKAAFTAEAIKRAAYVFMDRADISLQATESQWQCMITARAGQSFTVEQLAEAFRREVLDQDLRLTIEAKTEATRTAILGLAFSRTGLQGE